MLAAPVGIPDDRKKYIPPGKRSRHQKGIKRVQEPSMPGHNMTTVFDTRHSFQFAFQQIAKCTGDSSDGCNSHPLSGSKEAPSRWIIQKPGNSPHDSNG